SQMRGVWSGRPGSNRRHLPWQGSTLPLSYSRPATVSIAMECGAGQRCIGLWTILLLHRTDVGHEAAAGDHGGAFADDARREGDQKLGGVAFHGPVGALKARDFAEAGEAVDGALLGSRDLACHQDGSVRGDGDVGGECAVVQYRNVI